MNSNTKNYIWGAIALLGIGFFLMRNQGLMPSPQANHAPPQQQTPGAIQWNIPTLK